MDVSVIGGGPGGLYASILLQKANPDWEITVHERNPQGVTYGWGIVLPNRTLSNLRAADAPSYEAIDERSTQWEPFDLYYGGERYRSSGHSFASMLRTDLLELLQERCRDLGVALEFESEIDDPQSLAAASDLVIGADGIHSETRSEFADEFGAETVDGEARFSWFGTEADFDALSHIFVENEDGIWCAHTYPGEVSTFIVDCDAETWANADLDQRSEEEYLAYLEDVFAEHLDGHELLSQVDRWQTFTTVRNERWSHDNLVLIGDAAHTAHYSIGSGTTLAMEDAIALADAIGESDADVGTALESYEQQRRPIAESLQRSGERSRLHFEDIRRFYGFDGIQFVLHHLTRSGRLTYDSMSRRDPDLVEEFERWFAASSPGGAATPEQADPVSPATQPLELRDLTLSNRAVRVAGQTFDARDGRPTDAQLAAVRERSNDGAGLTMTEPLAVSEDGRITPGSPGLYSDDHVSAWQETIASADTPVGSTLVHTGTNGARQTQPFGLEGPIPRNESWASRVTDQYSNPPRTYAPDRLQGEDLERIERTFADAARRADDAGFDYLQLQLGNGYLLGSFLSPLTNDRTDAYGGDLESRVQFPLEVVDAVRDAWPDSKPLGAVVQATDWAADGLTLEDSFAVGRALSDRGVDVLAPVAGGVSDDQHRGDVHGLANFSDELRNEVGLPTMATVQATTSDEVNTLVGTSRADLCTYYGSVNEL
ncbi:oxidoreductase [Natronolimnohabitans innermongolicus]|uniref:Oxidoreductase n=1 Tax=Natronolimnohabitans innermongolicus JCM 12255 TaxID=1227499 RepID=L9WKW2_9EURY|nr:FAD-dependent monooxygenase [Natronolimnohabitans innermongolicus]ELY50135.1 oxidoreductase [Natronolimnohabitans innermongolicus JCM 12255]